MSNNSNINLLEMAAEIIDEGYINKYDLSTLERALEHNDLDMVHAIVRKYNNQSLHEEFGDV